MRKRWIALALACALVGAGLWLTRGAPLSFGDQLMYEKRDRQGDPAAGALIFAAAGCASCHASTDPQDPTLSGGQAFVSDFGTFYAPNISSDPTHGIGDWNLPQLARALTKGVSPEGRHYYPAFPYTAYAGMTVQDVTDLMAHLRSLPPSATPSKAHDVGFPFNLRRGIGLWKLLHMPATTPDPQDRGAYLVESLAHCGECHTPRNALGGLKRDAWMAGAPNPSGKGTIPNITPAQLTWSEAELVEYLTSGFTPEYDSAGGKMAEVVENLAVLPESDRAAIAAYILALPPVE